jgi:hypothetical protein
MTLTAVPPTIAVRKTACAARAALAADVTRKIQTRSARQVKFAKRTPGSRLTRKRQTLASISVVPPMTRLCVAHLRRCVGRIVLVPPTAALRRVKIQAMVSVGFAPGSVKAAGRATTTSLAGLASVVSQVPMASVPAALHRVRSKSVVKLARSVPTYVRPARRTATHANAGPIPIAARAVARAAAGPSAMSPGSALRRQRRPCSPCPMATAGPSL